MLSSDPDGIDPAPNPKPLAELSAPADLALDAASSCLLLASCLDATRSASLAWNPGEQKSATSAGKHAPTSSTSSATPGSSPVGPSLRDRICRSPPLSTNCCLCLASSGSTAAARRSISLARGGGLALSRGQRASNLEHLLTIALSALYDLFLRSSDASSCNAAASKCLRTSPSASASACLAVHRPACPRAHTAAAFT